MIVEGKTIGELGPLKKFNWSCPFCKRGFEDVGSAGLQPKHMVCPDCSEAYERKVMANYVLDDLHLKVARRVASLDDKTRKRETLEQWEILANRGTLQTRACYGKMLEAAKRVQLGIDEPVPQDQKKKFRSNQ